MKEDYVMRTAINSPEYHVPIDGFSQLIPVEGGTRLLLLSGLTSRSFEGEVVALGDMRGQAAQIMSNMKHILAEAGASLDDVVQIRTYITDITRWSEVESVWKGCWGEVWPVSTMVQISRLFDVRQLIEIEAVAAIPSNRS